ncbi:MAG: hypothetical protein EBQ95_02825 [Gammaproteobacteria bacterium]|nr:hypothetical protein [Gammaproteobacteria bacterium]
MDLFLQNTWYIFIISFLVMLIGQSVSTLLPKPARIPYSFFLSPLFGLAIVMLCSMAYGWLFAFQFKHSILIASILVCLSLWHSKERIVYIKNSLLFGGFAVFASTPFLIPFLKFGGYNTGTDIYTYLSQAQWMQAHPFKETVSPTGYFPYLTQISLYQKTGSRMGASFILAYWQSLLHLSWAYEAFFPAVSVAFASGCLALIAGVRQLVNIPFLRSICLAFWTAFSLNGFQFGAAWGFYPQTYGLAFMSGILGLMPLIYNYFVKNSQDKLKDKIVQCLPLALLMGSFLQAYNEPFLIFGFAFGLFMLASLVLFPAHRKIWAQFSIILFIEVAIFTNYEIIRIYHNLFQTLKITSSVGSIGWIVPWNPWQFLAYSFGLQLTFGYLTLNKILAYLVFSSIFVVMLWCFKKLWQEKNIDKQTQIVWLISIFIACALAFIKFRYFMHSSMPNEQGFTFLQFKISKYLTPLSQIFVLTTFAYLWKTLLNYRIHLDILYAISLLICLGFHSSKLPNYLHAYFFAQMHTTKYSMDNWIQLRKKIDFIPKNQPLLLNFNESEAKIKQMLTYIFYDRMVTADFTDDGYIQGKLPISERIKSRKKVHYQISIRTLKEEKSLIDDPVFTLKRYEGNNI